MTVDDAARPSATMMRTFLLISVGGLVGANARFLVALWAVARWPHGFPYGTLMVNVSGCFAIGFFLTFVSARLDNNADARLLIATGFLGAFTTFSTFGYETVALARGGAPLAAVTYVAASVGLGLAAVVAGIAIARLF